MTKRSAWQRQPGDTRRALLLLLAASCGGLGLTQPYPGPAWTSPKIHHSPGCLHRGGWHDIAAALTFSGSHHVFQGCPHGESCSAFPLYRDSLRALFTQDPFPESIHPSMPFLGISRGLRGFVFNVHSTGVGPSAQSPLRSTGSGVGPTPAQTTS